MKTDMFSYDDLFLFGAIMHNKKTETSFMTENELSPRRI